MHCTIHIGEAFLKDTARDWLRSTEQAVCCNFF